jgi:hypothetical protein
MIGLIDRTWGEGVPIAEKHASVKAAELGKEDVPG